MKLAILVRCLAFAVATVFSSAVAQEEAVMKRSGAVVARPTASMKHVGARTQPRALRTAGAVEASAKKATRFAVRRLPVHFRG